MSNDNTYTSLSLSQAIEFFSSEIGKLMLDGISYYTQDTAELEGLSIMRSPVDTRITIGSYEYVFRHWLSGVAGFTVTSTRTEAYARIGAEWVNLN